MFFVHKGEKFLAVAQNNDERVLVVGLNGEVKQELAKPDGTEFAFAEANDYYKQYAPGQKGKVCCLRPQLFDFSPGSSLVRFSSRSSAALT